jgi:[acyl-carrier-protein] S-malonyltransferase
MFPGQGSQFPGMAMDLVREVPAAREMLEEADDILGYSLSKIMAGDEGEELNRTVHTQPAIFVHSMALFEALQNRCPLSPIMAAGILSESTPLSVLQEFSISETPWR